MIAGWSSFLLKRSGVSFKRQTAASSDPSLSKSATASPRLAPTA